MRDDLYPHRPVTTRDYVQCRRCQYSGCVWVRSPKTQKVYLANAALENNVATPIPHFRTCTGK
jgi:hypothetical protein